jgi:hypothetical protein
MRSPLHSSGEAEGGDIERVKACIFAGPCERRSDGCASPATGCAARTDASARQEEHTDDCPVSREVPTASGRVVTLTLEEREAARFSTSVGTGRA